MLEILPIHRGEIESLIQLTDDFMRGDEPFVVAIDFQHRRDWREAVQG